MLCQFPCFVETQQPATKTAGFFLAGQLGRKGVVWRVVPEIGIIVTFKDGTMSDATNIPLDAVSEIVRWSVKLPLWQQDALRRIVEHGDLEDGDVSELADFCKRDARFSLADDAKRPIPLDVSTASSSTAPGISITLASISNVQHCNAICEKQVISFGADGLTVVFGYNGSGKSGYGRVLRKACRARHKERGPILPNAFQPSPNAPASAEIEFAVNGKEQPASQWIDGLKHDEPLRNVSFFDSSCARVHVGEKNDIAFRPQALCILETLAQTCGNVRDELHTERARLDGRRPTFVFDNPTRPQTEVGGMIRVIHARTDAAKFRTLATLSEGEINRVKTIRDALQHDHVQLAADKRAKANRVDDLADLIATGVNLADDAALENVQAKFEDWQVKKSAAELAAKLSFDDEPLPQVGCDVWRRLWKAAREYSTTAAYPEMPFPFVGEGARCVLCHQELGPEAADRLARFEAFIQDSTATEAESAKRLVDTAMADLDNCMASLRGHEFRELICAYLLLAPESKAIVKKAFAMILRRIRAFKRDPSKANTSWQQLRFDNCKPLIGAVSTALRDEATKLDALADPSGRQQLASELAGLEDRIWLNTVLDDVLKEVDRQVELARYDKCIVACTTTKITVESKKIAKQFVTDALRLAFAKELKRINDGVRRVEVELEAAEGNRGTPYYQVRLIGARGAEVPAVVSEGEHRCIALAGFLAELAMDGGRSAIVLDDPVCSLDHLWRDSFARRIVEESKDRQVIVFTHDVGFLHSLQEEAVEQGVPLHLRRVISTRGKSGVVSDEMPSVAQTVKQRMDSLEKGIGPLREVFGGGDEDAYADKVYSYYGRLRATIERIVVDVYFANIVQRHREHVAINHRLIKRVGVITESDWDQLRLLHKQCCNLTEAHDRGELRSHASAPSPDQIKTEVGQLTQLVKDIRARQKAAEESLDKGREGVSMLA